MARLIVSSEKLAAQSVEIGDHLTIGRSASNKLVLDDQKASRNHAEIRHLGRERYRVSDIGSANGTWFNGRRMTAPRDLQNGDEIQIGGVKMRFELISAEPTNPYITTSTGTKLELLNELVIVLVADVRNYTSMSEALPGQEFSTLINDWFRQATDLIDENGGNVDKFIGDAVMAYWIAANKSDPAPEVNHALAAARALVLRSRTFSIRCSEKFPGYAFNIGIGVNMGVATVCNVGTADHQSFTAVGDSVNVAFRLEPLSKTMGYSVILNREMAGLASGEFQFHDLGETLVKGRSHPVPIAGLKIENETGE